jgi:hypothetical protein
MSLSSGRRILRDHWTELPMPHDAITRVGQLAREQGMPKTLTFADRYGFEIPDADDDVDDDHDSDYAPSDDEQSDGSDDDGSYTSESDPGSDDGRDGDIAQPLPGLKQEWMVK